MFAFLNLGSGYQCVRTFIRTEVYSQSTVAAWRAAFLSGNPILLMSQLDLYEMIISKGQKAHPTYCFPILAYLPSVEEVGTFFRRPHI